MDLSELLTTKPSDMAVALYLRPIHPEFFNIYTWRCYRGDGYDAQLWITGLSHVLSVSRTGGRRAAERCVTEVVGPAAVELPRRGRVEAAPLGGTSELRFDLRNGFRYQMSFETETVADADVFAAVYDDLRNQGHKEGLACEYRLDGVQRDLWPLAMTVPTATRGGFVLHAFHVFPDHRAILKTQTLIELPGDK
jgi:hypothetical protein